MTSTPILDGGTHPIKHTTIHKNYKNHTTQSEGGVTHRKQGDRWTLMFLWRFSKRLYLRM